MGKPGLYPDGRTLGWIVVGGAASALCFFASILVPLIGSFIGILAPVPIMTLYLRKGWGEAAFSAAVGALVIGLGLKPMVALYFLVQFAMLGWVASYLIEKRMPFGVVMLFSSLAVAGGFFLLIGVQAIAAHKGLFEILKKPLQDNIQGVLSAYPGLTGTKARETEVMFRKMLSILIVLIPALILIGSWMILLIDIYIIDRFRLYPEKKLMKLYDLNTWKAPDPLIWFVIVPGFAVFLMHGTVRMIALNILIVVLTIYFFQGLCVVNHYFNRKRASSFIRFLFYLLMFLLQIVAIAVLLIGLLDMWMDFRKIFHKKDISHGSNGHPPNQNDE